MSEPTEKQLKAIKFIQDITGYEYEGTNVYDAWLFINKYLDEAHKERGRRIRIESALRQEAIQRHRYSRSYGISDAEASEHGYDASDFC